MSSVLQEPDAGLEQLAERLMSHVARRQNGGRLKGLYGEFRLVVSVQDGSLNLFSLEGTERFKPTAKR